MISTPALPPPPTNRLARFSVEQYHRMIASGAFTEDDRIELLAGWVVEKMPKNPSHSIVTGNLQDVIAAQLPEGWHLRNQEPITLADSEPEPDLAVVKGGRNDYAQSHPGPAQVALVIEVSDSTLRDDRWKQAIYAEAGIPTSIIVNLSDRTIEVYSSPNPTGFRTQKTHKIGDVVHAAINGSQVQFRLRDLMPA